MLVYQVAQVLYLPRMSRARSEGRLGDARRLLVVALGLAALAGVATVLVMTLAGDWITTLFFGPAFVADPAARLWIAVGVACFLLALILSDTGIAWGGHSLVVRSWVIGVAVGLLTAALVRDTVLAVTLPLVVGSLVAALQLGVGVQRRLRRA